MISTNELKAKTNLGHQISQVSNFKALLPKPSKLDNINSREKSPKPQASILTLAMSDLTPNPNLNTSDLPNHASIQTDSSLIPTQGHLTISNILETQVLENKSLPSSSQKGSWNQTKENIGKSHAQEADLKKTYKEALLLTSANKIGSVGRPQESLARRTSDGSYTEDLLQQTTTEDVESHPVLQISKGILQDLSNR